jgi:hypothetical protein
MSRDPWLTEWLRTWLTPDPPQPANPASSPDTPPTATREPPPVQLFEPGYLTLPM